MFPETIETGSLELERFCGDRVDVFELYETFGAGRVDPGVFEYVPQDPYDTVKEAHDRLRDAEDEWEDREAAEYGVYVGDAFAGHAALSVDWERRTGHLGTVLARPHWGQGYAGECARALTALAFERLDLELVAIGHEAGNERSARAVEKFVDAVGGQYDGVLRNRTRVGDELLDHHRYTVDRAAYRAATDGS